MAEIKLNNVNNELNKKQVKSKKQLKARINKRKEKNNKVNKGNKFKIKGKLIF